MKLGITVTGSRAVHGPQRSRTQYRDNTFPPHSCLCTHPSTFAFTLVEILVAIGILALALVAIFSSWTAILRASKVGLDAAAAVQRARIVMRTLEDSLLCAQSFDLNQAYYGFLAENGSEASLSFVARLPDSFPRNRKFGDLHVRRVTFSVESGAESSHQLVLRQSPLIMELDKDEQEHPLVLAKYITEFKMEFWDTRANDWVDDWRQTNQLPKLVKFYLKLADSAQTLHRPQQEITRIVNLPATMVRREWQIPGLQRPGAPGAPGPAPVPMQPIPGTQFNPPPVRPQ
jgi:type II secretory pathway pseudopilin PulG